MRKKVTDEEKTQVAKKEQLYKWIMGLLFAILLIALTSFITDVQRKADVDYVDKQDAKMKDERTIQINNINESFNQFRHDHEIQNQKTEEREMRIEAKIDKILGLDYIYENRPKRELKK